MSKAETGKFVSHTLCSWCWWWCHRHISLPFHYVFSHPLRTLFDSPSPSSAPKRHHSDRWHPPTPFNQNMVLSFLSVEEHVSEKPPTRSLCPTTQQVSTSEVQAEKLSVGASVGFPPVASVTLHTHSHATMHHHHLPFSPVATTFPTSPCRITVSYSALINLWIFS